MSADAVLLHHRVSQFLYREALLLDEQQWDDWAALFTADGVYWAPATPEQPDPVNHVSLIYEDDLLRKVRIARFKSPAAYSLQPFPHTSHMVANIIVGDSNDGALDVSARFQMTEFRRDDPISYTGAYHYLLIEDGDGFKIRQKKAVLVNCNGAHESSSVYF